MRPIRSDSYAARPRSRCRRRRCGSTSLDSCNSASNNLPTLHCKFDESCLISLDTFRFASFAIASITTTQRYARLTDAAVRAEAGRLRRNGEETGEVGLERGAAEPRKFV